MADPYVLDTSALFCLKEDEEGAASVERILRRERAYASFASFMEYFYVVHQEQGEPEAQRAYLELKQLPIQVVESDEELGLMAGRLKALHRLSFADAWVAATAERLGATLAHKDPEFDALEDRIRMLRLPPKNR